MDVIKPKLVWVEGRCYRFCDSDVWSAKDLASTPYVEDSDCQEFSDLIETDVCSMDIKVDPIEGGKYKHCFYVPNVFFKFIIGANGAIKKKIENDTRTTIKIPRMGKDGDIVLIGSSESFVVSARHRIDLIVENSRIKLKPTHFLSIPVNNEDIATNYEKFKHIVLNETAKDARGIQERLFQKVEKMHLTLGMLVLVDDKEANLAIQALEECKKEILRPFLEQRAPIKIKVQGLDIMNDDPSDVDVVYGKVSTENNVLQELADKTFDFFVDKGLMTKRRESVKLHLTLMNSSFLLEHDSATHHRKEKFDATNILKIHSDYFFGEVMLKTIHLCKRGIKAEDGYYVITFKIDLAD